MREQWRNNMEDNTKERRKYRSCFQSCKPSTVFRQLGRQRRRRVPHKGREGVKKPLFRNNKRSADRMTSGQLRLKLIAPWHQSALDSPHGVSSHRIEKALHLIGSFVSEWTRIVRCRREDDRDESQPTRVFFSCACTFHPTTTNRRRRGWTN
jgi:hypothetical protein